jgi:hypothetical protein
LWCHELKELEEQDRKLNELKNMEASYQMHNSINGTNDSYDSDLTHAFPNDASIINKEDSFCNQMDLSHVSNESEGGKNDIEILETSTTETDIVAKVLSRLHSTAETASVSDQYLQALANSLGISIKKESMNEDMATSYIAKQKEWFTNDIQAKQAVSGNKYKYLAKCLQIPTRTKKPMNKEKLESLRQDLVSKFISTDNNTIVSMGNIQALSKLNGIYFLDGTLSIKGKKDLLLLAIKFCEKGITMLPNQDAFSLKTLQVYLSNEDISNEQQKVPIIETENNTTSNNNINSQRAIIPSRISVRKTKRHPNAAELRKARPLTTRVELRLHLQPNNQDIGTVTHLKRQLQEIVDKLVDVDNSVKFHPWYDEIPNSSLENNKVPEDLRSIHRFFPRVQTMRQGPTYGEFQISHKRNWEDIVRDLNPWLTSQKHGLYYQVLQCPLTTNIGWLLWSFRRLDTECLQKELEELYDIKVNLRYQNISIGQGKLAEGNMVRALHVVVDQRKADQISSIFQKAYSFQAEDFPLGIVMRFIPHILRVTSTKTAKIVKWRARQNIFLKGIESTTKPMTATSWEIMLLDTIRPNFGTLRKQLMAMKSKINQEEYLFLSVDVSFFRANEVLFSFLPRHEQEARNFVANIVPYFLHKFGIDTIKDVFYHEALVRAEQSVWNADTEEVVTSADLYLDQSGDILDDFDFLDAIGGGTVLPTTQPHDIDTREISRVERLFTGEDSTSVGTLFTQEYQLTKTSSQSKQIITPTNNSISATKSVSSTTTTIEDVERQMTAMSSEMETIKTMLTAVLKQQGGGNQQQPMLIQKVAQQETQDDADNHRNRVVCFQE